MKKLIEFFGTHGLFADLCTLFVFFVGIYSVLTIERKVFPNVQFEMVSVSTIFPGASSEEVERLITNNLEQELLEVEGVKKMTSYSMEGRSFILLQLDPDQTTVEEGKSEIQDVVDRVTDLPEDAEDPLVLALESKLEPIIQVSISSERPEAEVRKVAKRFERELEKVSGVAKVEIDGLRDIEFRVEARPEKLRAYQLTLDDLVSALRVQNTNVPGGFIEGGRGDQNRDVIVRTVGEFRSIEDVKNSVVRTNVLGRAILVSDVATVTETFEKASVYQRTNSRDSMNLTVMKKVSSDAIDVVDAVKKVVSGLEDKLPPNMYVSYINDSSYYIRRRLSVLSGNFIIGLGLVLVILSLIMPWRVAAITAVGIPFAFLGSIYIMDQAGISFNIITMMGLIIVVGMLVDDAIVVTENIVRHIESGVEPIKAGIRGAQEIWAPVTASVLTTVMAFFPMLTMDGIMGKFIRYIPLAVILALAISLYECFFILPHHLSRWVSPKSYEKKKGPLSFIRNFWEDSVVNAYTAVISNIVKKWQFRYGTLLATLLLVLGSFYLASVKLPFILFPKEGVDAFTINAEVEVGTPLSVMKEKMTEVEELVAQIPRSAMDDYTTKVGLRSLGTGDPETRRGNHFGQMLAYLKPENERDLKTADIVKDLREKVAKLGGFKTLVVEEINPGPPTGKGLSVGVNGRDYSSVLAVTEELKAFVYTIEGVTDISDSYEEGNEEIKVVVNRAEAMAAGLTVNSIGSAVRAAFEGLVATTIRLLDEEIDVRVSYPIAQRSQVRSLENLQISNNQGAMIPLKRVAKLERSKSIARYDHENNERQVRVFGSLDEKVTNSAKVTEQVKKKTAELSEKFPEVSFSFGGEEKDTQESLQSLAETALTALLGISLILVLLFGNIWQPILVVFTIPLGIISVIWAFIINQMPMSFLGAIGTVALAGVIVNNAIVLIDFINKERANGLDIRDSIIEAGKKRVRPIFLTTLTTVFGILPTAYGLGGLDQFVVPVAMALGWGMLFGSMLTVFVLPALVAVQDDFLGLIFRRKEV